MGIAGNRAFLWQNGSKIDLGALGSSASSASALNEAGQIAGYSKLTTTAPNGQIHYHRRVATPSRLIRP